MSWADFLKYSKYIAVFYGAAFVVGVLGIWMQPHAQWIWTAVMFFMAALAGNVALGFYHANHKGAMLMAKNEHLIKQGEAQVITGDGKTLALSSEAHVADMEDFMRHQIQKELRSQRGY